MDEPKKINLKAAEKHYMAHLTNVSNYQKTHPEKMSEKSKRYNEKIKSDPEKYALFLQSKRDHYHNIVKPRLQLLKDAKNKITQIIDA